MTDMDELLNEVFRKVVWNNEWEEENGKRNSNNRSR